MKKRFEIIGLCIGWFAVIAQFFLMLQNRQADISETIIRFFSFFTILTNILVALFFTTSTFKLKGVPFKFLSGNGAITAITSFILIVGLVYQITLRKIWNPTGLQYVIDELLHTVIPLFMFLFWWYNVKRSDLRLKPMLYWLLYPVAYILFILIRGHFSGFYPYPFLNVTEIGYGQMLLNLGIVCGVAVATMAVLLLIGNLISKKQARNI